MWSYSEYSFTVKGVPFNVTVFATNGRGNGESVSEVVYVEEDGMWKDYSVHTRFFPFLQFLSP